LILIDCPSLFQFAVSVVRLRVVEPLLRAAAIGLAIEHVRSLMWDADFASLLVAARLGFSSGLQRLIKFFGPSATRG